MSNENNLETKGFASFKQNFGIENDKIEKYKKGHIIQQIENIDEYINNPWKYFIVLKGRVRVYFHRPGTIFKPINIQNNTDRQHLKIERLSPVDFGDLQYFGDFKQLIKENSFVNYLYYEAMEHWKIIEWNEEEWKEYMSTILENYHQEEKLHFLNETVQGMDKISAVLRRKISNCFSERVFMPRMKLISEGETSNTAYIIKRGTWYLVSTKNPLLSKVSQKGHIIVEKSKKMMSNKGYISETTSTFQLGLRTSGQWVGEDILILNDLPFPFSIIAKTEVVALAISKQDLQSKIPSEFRHMLEENARDRNKWLQKRIREITKTSHIIYSQDHKQTVYDKVLNQLISRHPQAISNALKSFTNHHVSLTGMENSGKIIKQVSINHRKSNK